MLISIALVAAAFSAIVLVSVFRPERRKQYNEFRRPVGTVSRAATYGDTGAAGISSGGCGGDGGGGSC